LRGSWGHDLNPLAAVAKGGVAFSEMIIIIFLSVHIMFELEDWIMIFETLALSDQEILVGR